jgi:hypothetical protein
MIDCCNSSDLEIRPKKLACPVNGIRYTGVEAKTILHHVKQPWSLDLKDQGYYFCEDENCDVAYFGEDGSTISKQLLRHLIGAKEKNPESLVCFCFGVSKAVAYSNAAVRDYVVAQTKAGTCSCVTHNPSGRCCLKDFPKNIVQ